MNFHPMYSIAANSTDEDKVDEKVEDFFIKLLKETSDKQSEYISSLQDNRNSKRPILPYTDLFNTLAKDLYKIQNRYEEELKKLEIEKKNPPPEIETQLDFQFIEMK